MRLVEPLYLCEVVTVSVTHLKLEPLETEIVLII
jgi:hypothetical protein